MTVSRRTKYYYQQGYLHSCGYLNLILTEIYHLNSVEAKEDTKTDVVCSECGRTEGWVRVVVATDMKNLTYRWVHPFPVRGGPATFGADDNVPLDVEEDEWQDLFPQTYRRQENRWRKLRDNPSRNDSRQMATDKFL